MPCIERDRKMFNLAILHTTLCGSLIVAKQSARYFRKITETVLRWYNELEDGMVQTDSGSVFDPRVLNYRMDVETVLRRFTQQEQGLVELIHRDGCTQVQAVELMGYDTTRPDMVVANVEVRMGQAFERHKLDEFLKYVDYLR